MSLYEYRIVFKNGEERRFQAEKHQDNGQKLILQASARDEIPFSLDEVEEYSWKLRAEPHELYLEDNSYLEVLADDYVWTDDFVVFYINGEEVFRIEESKVGCVGPLVYMRSHANSLPRVRELS
ncbi:hypothetical protein [Verrucomicrobium sp. BvORR106]|uniref:hypothetical protein n=1 Tax=Verrucomicrobium sp. BvORR106 TaxID=1403819 RepID=UPI0005715A7C|nr:hypothetical protein [Verrucomicrobium sp. BvORR106]